MGFKMIRLHALNSLGSLQRVIQDYRTFQVQCLTISKQIHMKTFSGWDSFCRSMFLNAVVAQKAMQMKHLSYLI